MKADPEVKMISAEAPILFAKGCDIFITELTMRAWIPAEENKRRTLQRSDIASALTKSDMFDFLIDIVPREEANHSKRTAGQSAAGPTVGGMPGGNASGLGPHATPADFTLGGPHGMPQDQDSAFRYNQGVQPGAGAPYGLQSYPDMDGLYSGYPMQPSQIYQVPQRGHMGHSEEQVPVTGAAHSYARHDTGEGDADAEGDRDYEVG